MHVLEVNHLMKSFGTVQAVQGVSFQVKQGEVFTIIGPNGAGKTTTLEMIEGLVPPDQGEIKFGELNWKKNGDAIKKKIGVQPQLSAMFDLLTPSEHLQLFASFYDKNRPEEEILKTVNLTEHKDKQVRNLSGGQRQRLAIGLAMIGDPEIIFLDEPTTGLDPQARRNLWDIILRLKNLDKTIILTTHYMDEAEQLSDRVCIIDQGEIVTIDQPDSLIKRLTVEREVRLSFLEHEEAAINSEKILNKLTVVSRIDRDSTELKIWTEDPEYTLLELFNYTKQQNYQVDQISIREMSLEDVFIEFTGKEWRD
ncbi:ABC transporter ATP-binding protein [Alkalibacillus haloalkaliphilus]|uniref:ABC transporter ATP-binding protein n=1 Tax=Alkalibacillus haloalkaliphilus TaxID=94136 RepID=A0A511W2X2_9BACI|nr:ATP-binding cassette domain-containing protein [Alkalibacillus haloalkaliphilus]GEN45436.1 ABC transporter ATP-binding protein [Alkalibacillus haloalkaliphilus]